MKRSYATVGITNLGGIFKKAKLASEEKTREKTREETEQTPAQIASLYRGTSDLYDPSQGDSELQSSKIFKGKSEEKPEESFIEVDSQDAFPEITP